MALVAKVFPSVDHPSTQHFIKSINDASQQHNELSLIHVGPTAINLIVAFAILHPLSM